MNFGKAMSFASPLAGMLSGNGAGMLPYLSPAFGMLSGKGPFGKMVDDEDDPIRKLLGGGMFGAGLPGMFGGSQ